MSSAKRRIGPERNLFRFRKIDSDKAGARNVVTNDHGAFAILDDDQLDLLVKGRVKRGTDLFKELKEKGFLLDEEDIARVAADLDRRVGYLYRGPVLHIMVVTLRCNEVCRYCHASRASMKETETDMSIPTSEKVVDMIMRAPSDTLTIEFQGGEPLANWEVVRHVVDYAMEEGRKAGKRIMFSLVSNLSMMDDEKLAWLIDHKVQISTSLDGPKELHDENRKLAGGSAYEDCVKWMGRINQAYLDAGLDPDLYHVEALATITRKHLDHPKELVDEYIAQGCRAIFLRPLNPFGFAKTKISSNDYTGQEFLEFYVKALEYIIEQNRKGVEILERLAAIFLTKVLTPDDPNYMDIRSPCGAGIGQIAYNYDGGIFTCDEGRMVFQMGDDLFKLGDVDSMELRDVVTHDTVKSLALASTLDSIPGCAQCAYKPYCGTCPVYNYTEQGNIFPQNPTNDRCTIYMGVQDRLFQYLVDDDKEIIDLFHRWVEVKDRPEYMHDERRSEDR
ncbi:MAG: His-Xaa-Ser system radical SAM maturase HxsB [Deltaproteobacteria bacterium]|nr:His-Xaa-Ser system radical SAM maturase HxsB [Deltaproteobacteria bacterium]